MTIDARTTKQKTAVVTRMRAACADKPSDTSWSLSLHEVAWLCNELSFGTMTILPVAVQLDL